MNNNYLTRGEVAAMQSHPSRRNTSRSASRFAVFALVGDSGVILSAWLRKVDAYAELARLSESGLAYGVAIVKVTVNK